MSAAVGRWMTAHPDFVGIFANGGVNVFPSRTELLRLPVGDVGAAGLAAALGEAGRRTRSFLGRMISLPRDEA